MTTSYIGFGKRLLAAVVDGLFLTIFFAIFFAFTAHDGGIKWSFFLGSPFLSYSFSENLAGNILRVFLSLAYYVLTTWRTGSTLGKRVFNIKVVDESGSKASFAAVLLRESFGKFVSTIALGLGYLWVIWDSKRQGWHDKIARTIVVQR